MEFIFNEKKSLKLKYERGMSFEEIIEAIEKSERIIFIEHRDPNKYPLQQIMILEINGYAWEVPFIQQENNIILKTAYPSRKATVKYLKNLEDTQ